MTITLSLTAPDLDEEDLQALTREVALTLNRETEAKADLPEKPGRPGSKGEAGLLGQIIITLISSGGIGVALIGVLKAYFERSKSLEMEFTREDGRKMKIAGDDLPPERIEQVLTLARAFFAER